MRNQLNNSDNDGQSLGVNPPESSKESYYNQFGLRHKSYIFKDFQDYMCTVFAEGDGATCLDDDFPDAFDDWVQDIDVDS